MPCDVKNQMLGPNGAAFVFGPQKGAKPEDLPVLDVLMEKTIRLMIDAIHSSLGQDERDALFNAVATNKGTGAAGGLVAANLTCFKNT